MRPARTTCLVRLPLQSFSRSSIEQHQAWYLHATLPSIGVFVLRSATAASLAPVSRADSQPLHVLSVLSALRIVLLAKRG